MRGTMVRTVSFLLAAAIAAGCATGPKPDPQGLDPYARYLGAVELAKTGDPVDAREIVRMLEDADELARDGAVVALGQLRRPEHVPALIEMTFERIEQARTCPKHPEIVRSVPDACPLCGAELQAVPGSRGGVRSTPLVRADAVRALAVIGDARAVAAVCGALRGDGSIEVRRTAALALEAFADQRAALEALVDALEDRAAAVSHNAHGTLCRIARRDDLPRKAAPWREWLRGRTP